MSLFAWFKRGQNEDEKKRRRWRQACAAAIDAEDGARLPDLRAELGVTGTGDEDVEIELEMLEALERVAQLRLDADAGRLPAIETHHRVIGAERCLFSAPASVPDDPHQPSGRVLFTPTRSLFVGAGKTAVHPWHAIQHAVRTDRDLLLARGDGAGGARFRFNSFGDAAVAASLARRLKGTRQPRVL